MMNGRKSTSGVGSPLLLVHLGAREVLVLVGGEERANQAGRLVGDLAERVARKVRTRVLRMRPLRRGRPAAQVDGLDPHPLHHHGLTGRVRAEGRDLPALGEQLAKSGIEPLGGRSRDGVVRLDRALLGGDLTGGMETHDPVEPGLREPFAGGRDLRLERVIAARMRVIGCLLVLVVPEAVVRALALGPEAVRARPGPTSEPSSSTARPSTHRCEGSSEPTDVVDRLP